MRHFQWEDYYDLFVERYRGRSDVVAVQQKDGSFVQLAGGLTVDRFLGHMEMTDTYGIYQMDDQACVRFILFDMDVFPRRKRSGPELLAELSKKKGQVLMLRDTLMDLDIHEDQILVEFPTVGYHVVLFFDWPVPAQEAKTFARLALARAGLKYVAPFYPITTVGYGDMVRLPLRVNNLTDKRSVFISNLGTFDPAHYDPTPDFTPLERVRPISPAQFHRALERVAAINGFVKVAEVGELKPGEMKLVEAGDKRILLVNVRGEYHAVEEVCPHAEGPLSEGMLEGEEVECPWHGRRFNVRTGEALKRYPVRVERENILVGAP